MIRSGNRIRLSKKDKEQLIILTGSIPTMNTVDGLTRHIERAKETFSGDSPEEKLLRHLLDKLKPDQ